MSMTNRKQIARSREEALAAFVSKKVEIEAVEPGVYFLRFLFPTEQTDRFDVVDGPVIFVR
jgi:hypothetical protein